MTPISTSTRVLHSSISSNTTRRGVPLHAPSGSTLPTDLLTTTWGWCSNNRVRRPRQSKPTRKRAHLATKMMSRPPSARSLWTSVPSARTIPVVLLRPMCSPLSRRHQSAYASSSTANPRPSTLPRCPQHPHPRPIHPSPALAAHHPASPLSLRGSGPAHQSSHPRHRTKSAAPLAAHERAIQSRPALALAGPRPRRACLAPRRRWRTLATAHRALTTCTFLSGRAADSSPAPYSRGVLRRGLLT